MYIYRVLQDYHLYFQELISKKKPKLKNFKIHTYNSIGITRETMDQWFPNLTQSILYKYFYSIHNSSLTRQNHWHKIIIMICMTHSLCAAKIVFPSFLHHNLVISIVRNTSRHNAALSCKLTRICISISAMSNFRVIARHIPDRA